NSTGRQTRPGHPQKRTGSRTGLSRSTAKYPDELRATGRQAPVTLCQAQKKLEKTKVRREARDARSARPRDSPELYRTACAGGEAFLCREGGACQNASASLSRWT